MTVENSSSRTLHSICGSLLIALSLTDDGRLSTPLKCSAHLFNIASLSVRSVLPSALSSGVAPELFGPYIVFSASWNFVISFRSAKRLNFFCFLVQPGVVHVTEPVVDSLTNIVVGSLL